MTKKHKIRIAFRKYRRPLLYFGAALLVLLYLTVRMLPASTVFISAQSTPFAVQGRVYVFREEDYALLHGTEGIELLVESGEKVSASTLLSDNYTLDSSYIERVVEILDYMMTRPDADTSKEVYTWIYELKNTEHNLQNQLYAARQNEDEALIDELVSQIEQVQHERDMLYAGMPFANFTQAQKKNLRDKYASLADQDDIEMTMENLGFTTYGEIFYSIDGYEDLMGFKNMDDLNLDYLNNIDELSPYTELDEGDMYVKSSAGDIVFLAVRVPADTVLQYEERVSSKYNTYYTNYNMTLEGGYYHFLFRREDLLSTFPSISIEMSDGQVYTGYYIETKKYADEKIVVIAVRTKVSSFSEERIFDAALYTQQYRCYSLPQSAVYERDGATYVTVMYNGSTKKEVKVTVFETIGRTVYLRVVDNPDLKSGDEIVLKGR